MESVTVGEDYNQIYGVPIAKVIMEDVPNPIREDELQLENVCFSKNGINSVNRSTLRRRFKPKIKLLYWINKTKEVEKCKTNKFDF